MLPKSKLPKEVQLKALNNLAKSLMEEALRQSLKEK